VVGRAGSPVAPVREPAAPAAVPQPPYDIRIEHMSAPYEHGTRLSGGQRQRLALARVLLADFPVVIFDEPAEHLDEVTAGELTHDLIAATEGRTRILITHRFADRVHADRVLRLPGLWAQADGPDVPARSGTPRVYWDGT
jgi:ABC-type transport system involved in cytochrome bd biosynthesis fused ATPase/permease subunit